MINVDVLALSNEETRTRPKTPIQNTILAGDRAIIKVLLFYSITILFNKKKKKQDCGDSLHYF